jgi:hypothetical protein
MASGTILAVISILGWLVAPAPQRQVKVTITDSQGQTVPLYNSVHALVVGAGNYEHLPKLRNLRSEAEDAKNLFENLGYQVTLLIDPTSTALKEALNRLTYDVTDPNDAVLLFFAGHGYTEKLIDGTQLGYILPIDCPLPDLDPGKFTDLAISMSSIQDDALLVKSKHMSCIFDSCFAGTIFYVSRAVPEYVSDKTSQPVRQFITAGTEMRRFLT